MHAHDDFNLDLELLQAMETANFDKAATLVLNGAKQTFSGNKGNFPLHLAAKFGAEELFKILLQNGGDLLLTNEFFQTPYYIALENKSFNIASVIINHLLDTGNTISQIDLDEGLVYAVKSGELNFAKLVLSLGANPIQQIGEGEDDTLLNFAINGNDDSMTSLLWPHVFPEVTEANLQVNTQKQPIKDPQSTIITNKPETEIKIDANDLNNYLHNLNQLIVSQPDNVNLYCERAAYFQQQGMLKQVFGNYFMAIKKSSTAGEAHAKLAEFLLSVTDADQLDGINKTELGQAITLLPVNDKIKLIEACKNENNPLNQYLMGNEKAMFFGTLSFTDYGHNGAKVLTELSEMLVTSKKYEKCENHESMKKYYNNL